MNDAGTPQKILVIKLGALGDFIQALGPMAAIKKHHPNAHLTILTTRPFETFANECGYFNEIWIDDRPKFINLKNWINLRKKLNKQHFTRVYDLQNNDRTSFYFNLFKNNKKPEWVGTAAGASHRNISAKRTAGHAFDGHVQTLALAGIKNVEIDTLDWMNGDLTTFALKAPYILLVPGCAPKHPEKRWPAEKYGRLAKIIYSMGYQPVLIGTETEKEIANVIAQICPESLNLTGQTDLQQIASLAKTASGAIGNDTGPMHLIAATTCPCLVLFSGQSNPVRHAPKGKNIEILQKENLKNLKSEDVIEKFRPRQTTSNQSSTMH